MTNHPIIQPFLDYLKFEKRYSRHTLTSYETDLTYFFDYIVTQYGEMPLETISHIYIRSWLAGLKDEKNTSKTINRKISTLKSFFKYQLKTGKIKQTPMAKIVAPKNEKRLPHFVDQKDIRALFEHVEFTDDWPGKTERLLMQLFYSTGMRLSELIGLKESSVNFSNHSLKVLGKGNKERILPLSPELITGIKEYILQKKTEFPEAGNDYLLLSEKGKPFYPRAVYSIVRKYLNAVTTIEKRSPHVLRHTFATHLTNNGADLNAVKELLGHSSLAATQVYTHNTIEKLKNIYKQAHPKA
jgi:integrase/recombinase XerC